MSESFAYEDIVRLPRPRSAKHPPMSMEKRAAQFAPFAALRGHGEAVAETARLTDMYRRPDEAVAQEIDRALRDIAAGDAPTAVRLTWFEPDAYKEGGRYVTAEVTVVEVNAARKTVKLADGTCLPVAMLTAVEDCEN